MQRESNKIIAESRFSLPGDAARAVSAKNGQYPLLSEVNWASPWQGKVLITPECAEKALTINFGNRRKRTGFVAYIAQQIKTGQWQEDHPQPFVFSPKRMMDGQHRMFAIAEAGIAVVGNVVCGARDELREFIDTGLSRTLEDRISFSEDYADNHRIAAIVGSWWTVGTTGKAGKRRRVTPDEAHDIYTMNEKGILYAASVMAKKVRHICRSAVMVAVAEYYLKSEEQCEEFTEGLLRVDGRIQQAQVLRAWLTTDGAKFCGGGSAQSTLYAKTVCAMQAHRDDREIRSVRIGSWK